MTREDVIEILEMERIKCSGSYLSSSHLWINNKKYTYIFDAFSDKDLSGLDLSNLDFTGVDFSRSNLSNTNLSGSNLTRAFFNDANLESANLSNTILYYTQFFNTNLLNANIFNIDKYYYCCNFIVAKNVPELPSICPEHGSFIGYKIAGNYVIKLEIPDDARRISSFIGRRCRCDKAKVLEIQNIDGKKSERISIHSDYNPNFIYTIEKTVSVLDFDENRYNDNTIGIHFFMTRQEAITQFMLMKSCDFDGDILNIYKDRVNV